MVTRGTGATYHTPENDAQALTHSSQVLMKREAPVAGYSSSRGPKSRMNLNRVRTAIRKRSSEPPFRVFSMYGRMYPPGRECFKVCGRRQAPHSTNGKRGSSWSHTLPERYNTITRTFPPKKQTNFINGEFRKTIIAVLLSVRGFILPKRSIVTATAVAIIYCRQVEFPPRSLW